MSRGGIVGALGLVVALGAPSAALADFGPPPRVRKPKVVDRCKVARHEKKTGRECVACVATWDNKNICARQLDGMGYELRCKQKRTTSWREVWCQTAEAAASTSGDATASTSDGESHTTADGGESSQAVATRPIAMDEPPEGTGGADDLAAQHFGPQTPAWSQGCACVVREPARAPWLALGLLFVSRRRSRRT